MSNNLFDYDPNQQQPKKPQQPQAGGAGDIFSGAGQASQPPPPSAPQANGGPAMIGPNTGTPHMSAPYGTPPPIDRQPNIPQTLAGTTPGAGDVKPGPTLTPTASGAKRETMGGMNGVRLANGDWLPADHPGAIAAMGGESQAVYPGGPAAPGAAPGLPAAAPAPGAAPAPAPAAPDPNAPYKDALLKMLGDSQNPASLNDPALKAQSDAFSVGQQRSAEMQRAQSAERLAAQGLGSSGAADSEYSGITERAGENMAGFNAGLVGDANKSKLQQMTAALSMMGNDINSQAGRDLQKSIADMQAQIQRDQLSQQGKQFDVDADLRRLGITTQADLGGRDLSLRDKLGSGGLNLGVMQALMQNQQFGQGLGAQLGMFNANLNQNALMQLLGGL